MALKMGRGWMIGGAVAVLGAAIALWAWIDGGEQPLRTIEAEALLPRVGA